MSRGLGSKQERILSAIRDAGGIEMTSESLRWTMYEGFRGTLAEKFGKLDATWNNSFRRALLALGSRGLITLTSRALESFEECVAHYPGKTLLTDARNIRLDFLPVLQGWITAERGIGPKYGTAANEKHHLNLLPKNEHDALVADWMNLEERLRPIYGTAPRTASDGLLKVICKGRSLFRTGDVTAHGSLAELIGSACGSGSLSPEITASLNEFLDRFIPRETAAALEFKSLVHAFADVSRRGTCSLRKKTLEYLHDQKKETVEAMEGFEEKHPGVHGLWNLPHKEYNYPGSLRRLFDHSVFQKFDFIKLA